MDCASRRKSSSSARLSRSRRRRPARIGDAPTSPARRSAQKRSGSGDRPPAASDAGRWILTTTSSPGAVSRSAPGRSTPKRKVLLEGGEQVSWIAAQLFLRLVHFLGVGGRDGVEQAAELRDSGSPERARARRDDLSELDAGGAQVGEGLGDLLLTTLSCQGLLVGAWPGSAPVRVSCQLVAPMRAASIGSGTRSSFATSRLLVELIVEVCRLGRSRNLAAPLLRLGRPPCARQRSGPLIHGVSGLGVCSRGWGA